MQTSVDLWWFKEKAMIFPVVLTPSETDKDVMISFVILDQVCG